MLRRAILAHCAVLGLLLGLPASSHSAEGSGDLDEVTFGDAIRMAFYVRAPSPVANSMRKAVKLVCSGLSVSKEAAQASEELVAAASWLCRGDSLNYLRGVNLYGFKAMTGFICNSEGVSTDLKYYLEDMFSENPDCVWVGYDAQKKAHILY